MKTTQQSLSHGFLLLPLVVVMATMAAVGEAAVCSDVVAVGNVCDTSPGGACRNACIERHPDGQPSCDGNTCMCFYQCPGGPTRSPISNQCNLGLGRCTAECRDPCCNAKCAYYHVGGVGYCDDSLGKENALCQCQFPC